ncbi:hypothetical protein [Flavobacterium sp. GCM10023249]|uniref:hypothetical protein n=1 Tax=unclassified Flavobacterium TaxID=196869 RepID=UPI003617C681
MKKQRLIIFYCIFFVISIGYGQEFPERDKKYDLEIFDFLIASTEKGSISLDDFLSNTKPFSKWDIRPLKRETVWVLDTIHRASEVPNFIWGAFSSKYEVTQQDAIEKPNQLLNKAIKETNSYGNFLNQNLKKIEELTKHILESKNEIFLSQKNLQRVDNLYKENNQYWGYSISSNSPFPISNKVESYLKESYSKNQIKILDLLKELNIYSAKKTNKGIFYLVDGFTDNSYGFYFNQEGKMEEDNFLFQILKFKKINDTYFYYIAN